MTTGLLRQATMREARHDRAYWVWCYSASYKARKGPGVLRWVLLDAATADEAARRAPSESALGRLYGISGGFYLLHQPEGGQAWYETRGDVPDDVRALKHELLESP